MSVFAVTSVLHGALGIDPTQKLILLVIAEHANRDSGGRAWPSIATIARLGCVTDRRVQYNLRALEAAGWLSIEQRSAGGRGRTSVYRLNLPRMRQNMLLKGAADGTVGQHGGPPQRVPQTAPLPVAETVPPATGNGAAGGKKTLLPAAPEPSNEPNTNREPRRESTQQIDGDASLRNRLKKIEGGTGKKLVMQAVPPKRAKTREEEEASRQDQLRRLALLQSKP